MTAPTTTIQCKLVRLQKAEGDKSKIDPDSVMFLVCEDDPRAYPSSAVVGRFKLTFPTKPGALCMGGNLRLEPRDGD